MSQQWKETGDVSLLCGEAIEPHRRVMLNSSNRVVYADANDQAIGVSLDRTDAADDPVTVKLYTAAGSFPFTASEAITAGSLLYGAADGKLSDTPAGVLVGMTPHAYTGNGSRGEMYLIRNEPKVVVVEHHTASDTLTKEESGSVHTNLGASGAITFTLPQDAPKGTWFRFVAMAAQELRVDPGAAGALYVSGAKQSDDAYLSFDDEGEQVTVTADGNGDWMCGPSNGTFTIV